MMAGINMLSTINDVLFLLTLTAILVEALWDYFRSVEIPPLLVLVPLLISLMALLVQGEFLVLVLAILLVLFTEIRPNALRRIACLVCIGIFAFLRLDIGIFILIFWFLYEFNLMAGADTLACFSLLLVRPDLFLGWWLIMGIGLGALWTGLRRRGLTHFREMFQALGNIAKRPPTEDQLLEEGQPLLWTVFLGGIIYVIFDILIAGGGGS
jgi:hypothetical protein